MRKTGERWEQKEIHLENDEKNIEMENYGTMTKIINTEHLVLTLQKNRNRKLIFGVNANFLLSTSLWLADSITKFPILVLFPPLLWVTHECQPHIDMQPPVD